MCYEEDTSLCELLLRMDTVLMVSFMAVTNLKQAFYIQTVAQQLEVTWDLPLSTALSEYFDLIFPVLALVSTPMAVALFAYFKTCDHGYMAVCGGLMMAWSISQAIPSVASQYLAATLFGPARTLVWAAYFHFFQQASRYPPSKLGRLIGYSNLMVAIVGDLPPIPLYSYAESQHNDTASAKVFAAIHVVLTATGIGLLAVLLIYLRKHQRKLQEQSMMPMAAS